MSCKSPGDRADGDPPGRLARLIGQPGLEHGHRGLHGPRRDEQLGDEELARLEEAARLAHRGDQAVVEQCPRRNARRQPFGGEAGGRGGVAVEDRLAKALFTGEHGRHVRSPRGGSGPQRRCAAAAACFRRFQ